MKLFNDAVTDPEPDERPSRFGRLLLEVADRFPGQWRDVMEASESQVARFAGILNGSPRSTGRIAGVDPEGWEARKVRVDPESGTAVLRVRFTPPEPEFDVDDNDGSR